MQMNPIVKKDVRVQARSMRICWSIFVYELIMALVFFFAMLVIQQNNVYSTANIYSSIVWLYPVLAVTQLVILGVVIPVRTASAISGEKERQTFDIMMTTSMTPFAIIMGKVMSAMIQGMFFVVASMPVMALAFVIGGLSWSYLFWFVAVALLVSLFSASIGILCSSICKKSITAVIMSYGFYIVFFVASYIPIALAEFVVYSNGLNSNINAWYLLLISNPAVYLTEFFMRTMTGESLVGRMFNISTAGPVLKFISSGYWWMTFSTIFFVVISFIFLAIAARRINPIHGKSQKGVKQNKKHAQQGNATA